MEIGRGGVRIRRTCNEGNREALQIACETKKEKERNGERRKKKENIGKKTGNTTERQLLDWPLVIKSLSTTRPEHSAAPR